MLEKHPPSVGREGSRAAVVFSVLYAVTCIASLFSVPIMAPGARIPNPFGPDDLSRTFYLHSAEAVRMTAFLQLLSALCLAALAAVISGTQKNRASSASSALTMLGGGGGGVLLALTALCSWAIASPGAVDPGAAFRTLQFLPFLFGGPGWAGFFCLFMAGVVMGGSGVLPRWLSSSGYFLSAVSGLAMLTLLTIGAAVCLPIARFLGFLWLIAATTVLARKAD